MSLPKVVSGILCTACLWVAGSAIPASADSLSVGPGDSIQSAIDRAEPGDVIVVAPGVYEEALRITTDDLTLVGSPGTVLRPPPVTAPCDPAVPGSGGNGICVVGIVDLGGEEPTVVDAAEDVSIHGFQIEGFDGSGVIAVGASRLRVIDNVAVDTGSYGLAAFRSTGTRFISNRVSGSGEAAIYIGDSPDADARVLFNEVSGADVGVLVRNARGITIVGNDSHDNCAGILVLGDAPGPAGGGDIIGNRVHDNHRFCRASVEDPEAFPAFSGDGIDLIGATSVRVIGNLVTDNVPTGQPTPLGARFGGGVNVVPGPSGSPSSGNVIGGNIVLRNAPLDILSVGGADNVFWGNLCDAGEPAALCTR